MDLTIRRPTCQCAATGRSIDPGMPFYSALVRAAGGIERVDIVADAWQGPPERAIAWWRSRMPEAESKGPSLASPDVLLDVLERLEGDDDEASLRYLLALFLVRRRVLRVAEHGGPQDAEPSTLRVSCPRRAAEYRIRTMAGASDDVARRLTELLWSGEAA